MNDLVDDIETSVDFLKKKNSDYGNAKDVGGEVLAALFPNGITLACKQDFAEFAIVVHIVSKTCRFTNLWQNGVTNFESIQDTLGDLSNYGRILKIMIKRREEDECQAG